MIAVASLVPECAVRLGQPRLQRARFSAGHAAPREAIVKPLQPPHVAAQVERFAMRDLTAGQCAVDARVEPGDVASQLRSLPEASVMLP